mmetsp:Transcript_69465/g.163268  ORF Transcript_69465/g.163268 Transcript_69465/m.163268 type:complete len:201 (-) Transcript_69465:18-620(-)
MWVSHVVGICIWGANVLLWVPFPESFGLRTWLLSHLAPCLLLLLGPWSCVATTLSCETSPASCPEVRSHNGLFNKPFELFSLTTKRLNFFQKLRNGCVFAHRFLFKVSDPFDVFWSSGCRQNLEFKLLDALLQDGSQLFKLSLCAVVLLLRACLEISDLLQEPALLQVELHLRALLVLSHCLCHVLSPYIRCVLNRNSGL